MNTKGHNSTVAASPGLFVMGVIYKKQGEKMEGQKDPPNAF